MALSGKKITAAQLAAKGVVSAPDKLTGTAAENKAVFDRLVKELVAQSVNGLIDELTSLSGAGNIGASVEGLSGANVQTLLSGLKEYIDNQVVSAGAMTSFNGRKGAVVPAAGDYTADQITGLSAQISASAGTLQTQINTTNGTVTNLQTQINNLWEKIYPVGAIYMSVNITSPATLFGGTWVRWGTGRVPVGVNASYEPFNEPEKTGGSAHLQNHAHTGTTTAATGNGLIRVTHGSGSSTNLMHVAGALTSGAYTDRENTSFPGSNHIHTFTTSYVGEGQAGNLQPFITCYMWKRTA